MSVGSEAAAWWRNLQPTDTEGERRTGDRATLAQLRRCATVMDAATVPRIFKLACRLRAGADELARVALIGAVLAHVRKDVSTLPVARQIGKQPANIPAAMSELRFRRLLQAESDEERLTAFRRLVQLVGGTLNVADLADSLWNWDHEDRRRRWIYAYHNAPDFTPTHETPPDAAAPAQQDTAA